MTSHSAGDPGSRFARLVRDGARVRPMAAREREALYRRIEERTVAPPGAAWPLVAVACVAAAAACLFLVARGPASRAFVAALAAPPVSAPVGSVASERAPASPARVEVRGARRVSLQGRGELAFGANSVATLPTALETVRRGAVRVSLTAGRIDATVSPRAPDEPFTIVTPEVSVTVVGTQFSVSVEGDRTSVAVEHGRVRVEKGGVTLFVGSGEALRSDDPRFAPPPVTSDVRAVEPSRDTARKIASVNPESCTGLEPASARRCLARSTGASGLDGENALLSLALLERDQLKDSGAALSRLEQYELRYPRGVLAPEVALAKATTLAASGSSEAACKVGTEYATRFPGDRATIRRLNQFCAK